MAVRSFLKRVFRFATRWTCLAVLVSLPVTFFAFIAGIEGAITFHLWFRNQVTSHVNSLQFEESKNQFLNYYNVPGAISIHDYLDQQGPFHIPEIGSFDWLQKLSFVIPNEHQHVDAGVDKLASFDGLVREDTYRNDSRPTKFWVYVTSLPEWLGTEWDTAFSEVLQKLYVHPLPKDTAIVQLDCASAAFLCGVWCVKSPSLLHFVVEDQSLAEQEETATQDEVESSWADLLKEDFTYNLPNDRLYPVTVRMIELPLKAGNSLLPKSTLPTPALQLHSILRDPDSTSMVQNWAIYDQQIQIVRRYNDLQNELAETRGTWRYYLTKADVWYSQAILKPIFGQDFVGNYGVLADVQNVTFSIGILLCELIRFPFSLGWSVYAWYFGLGYNGEPIDNSVFGEEPQLGGQNWMEDMMLEFMQHVKEKTREAESEQAGRAAVTAST